MEHQIFNRADLGDYGRGFNRGRKEAMEQVSQLLQDEPVGKDTGMVDAIRNQLRHELREQLKSLGESK